ncbi:AGAP007894-PA [Anopheles gambiae str. PEST]|uniref:Ribosome-releasing factor 2, mitochondrial n=1 Tax=Anopheles gambiae TaxID=7165 RepID=RRF2M_ANOGA|nr:RecName: Full=Ribosome-releasing factor 2, mitochondrial; Short=RRF2mt; AltName: Full=Elongation factor G 2, mitochondrial; Short=EF-G2mt; Short=mEF-G 2; Flags: Precursor [Anopheles gambiae]EAA12772.4 AGAP007894-PA [Anopheles gambiae str. PEST]
MLCNRLHKAAFAARLRPRLPATVASCRQVHNSDGTISEKRIRNIGILAHIDAGKTTTTERMLYYSGRTDMLGEVKLGNTVTDFLQQERERGITICSAAVSFNWKEYRINLLDTPGHIDFTMEVEQSLGAVDGTVIILDGSAGVEAQTVTVWGQADRHRLPRLVFVNKMDKESADFDACLEDLEKKLSTVPVPLQMPIKEAGKLVGVIDVLSASQIIWDSKGKGRSYKAIPISDEQLHDQVQEKLYELIDLLSGMDDNLAQAIIEANSLENVKLNLVLDALRNCTLKQQIVPVLLGSSYKNVGVQLLMDSVLNFLPAPSERNQIYDLTNSQARIEGDFINVSTFRNDFVGKVFKVTHDKQRGPITMIRAFRGTVKKGSKFITATGGSETIQRIYEPLADEYREIESFGAGNIGLCAGPKSTVTGDLLLLASKLGLQTTIPDAVYFCSIEPPSSGQQSALDNALREIQREDPSLRVRYDEVTGQTVLGGMGQLHLEIVKSRILTEYRIDADLGPLQIAYKETLDEPCRGEWRAEKEIAGSKQSVYMDMTIHPSTASESNEERIVLDNSAEAQETLKLVRPRQMTFFRKGALAALQRGPKLGGQLANCTIKLHALTIGKGTADPFIMAASAQCIGNILANARCRLLEPDMFLEIVTPSEYLPPILADLSRRRARIEDVAPRGSANKVVTVIAPLAELGDYSTVLRTISSGTASVSMEPNGHSPLNESDEAQAMRRALGLE